VRVIRFVAVALSVQLASAIAASAQAVSVVPSFGISQVYDDNLFYRPVGEADTTTRFSPRVDLTYASERLTTSGRYTFDADRFTTHPELTTMHARQDAGIDARYHSSPRLSVGVSAAFAETQTAADLNAATALTPGRVRAQRATLHGVAEYQVGPRTALSAAYTVADDRLIGGVGLVTQRASSTIEHHASARADVRVESSYERYFFDGVGSRTSVALTAEWTREMTRGTNLALRLGPRAIDGALSPEIGASLHRQLHAGEASLSYAHTQTTLVGLAGTADAHSVTAAYGIERRRLKLRASPGLLRTRQAPLSAVVYRLSVSCVRPISQRLAVEAAYDMNVQRGNIYAVHTERIDRNLVSVKLAVSRLAW
jgi:hypothetical protein